MFHNRSRGLSCLALLLAWSAAADAAQPAVDFARQIRPILADSCFACHGPDEQTREAGLRLDRREGATGKLASGNRAIVAGGAEQSALLARITHADPEQRMPPPESGKKLSDQQQQLLARWIREGARYDVHWSLAPPRRPVAPRTKGQGWGRNEIDSFVLARLEQADLSPAPAADPTTLVRRVSLDLRGLPPTPEEVDQFLADRRAGAYERMVDRMLQSPHFGEKLAQDWLDLARYGDTNGYHADSDRSMWLYRDWVIYALNANMPFDQFVREQIAGDLMSNATATQMIASGFNRNTTFNEEGGADPDEFYVTYAVDRANTTAQALLGLTFGCAQCHDHKYDPLSQKEYYQFYSFFNSVEDEVGAGGSDGYHNKPLPPLLQAASPLRQPRLDRLDKQLAAAAARIQFELEKPRYANPSPATLAMIDAWEEQLRSGTAERRLPVTSGLRLWLDASDVNGNEVADADEPFQPPSRIGNWSDRSDKKNHAAAAGSPRFHPAGLGGKPSVEMDGEHDFVRTSAGGDQLSGDFTMVAVFQPTRLDNHQMLVMWGEEARGKRRAMWKTAGNNLFSFNGYHADVVGSAAIAAGRTYIAVMAKSGSRNRIDFYLNGHPAGGGQAQLESYANQAITVGANNAGLEKSAAHFAEVILYNRTLDKQQQNLVGRYLAGKYNVESNYEAAPRDVLDLVAIARQQRTADQRRRIRQYYFRHVHPPSRPVFTALEAEIVRLQQQQAAIRGELATTMVMKAMPKRRPAFVLARGDFQQPGERVQPDVPAIFPPLPADQPRNRLGLAYWLTRKDHPLVSRVRVNHLWKQLFGIGLVKTAGDFGAQGELPSHPAVLDWLAVEFIESGWDTKALLKKMVMSATYRQSSSLKNRIAAVDPHNRLLSRAPRFRMSAEEIRDSALAISGLLNRGLGGPSVRPYQPPGYYADKVGRNYEQSQGGDLYRRGLYTYWRRTAPYPAYIIFDAPSREFCTARRPRTNTPLQALVTLNDPVFVEAARVFAQQIIRRGGETPETKLAFAFRRAVSRRPTEKELDALTRIYQQQQRIYANRQDEAKQLATNGQWPVDERLDRAELAAWTAVASVILNLDETMTRE